MKRTMMIKGTTTKGTMMGKMRREIDRSGSTAGVTLVELLIAMMCLGIIMLAFTMIFMSLINVWISGSANVSIGQNVTNVFARTGKEIRGAFSPLQHDASNELNFIGYDSGTVPPVTVANSIADDLRFHTAVYSAAEGGRVAADYGGDPKRVWYWLKDDNYIRIQREGRNSKNTDRIEAHTTASSGGNPFGLHINDFDVQYQDAAGVWQSSWDARATNGVLPRLVRITLRGNKDGTTRIKSMVVRPMAQDLRITP